MKKMILNLVVWKKSMWLVLACLVLGTIPNAALAGQTQECTIDLSKTASPTTALVGDTVVYTMTVTVVNPGGCGPISQVVLTDPLPSEMTFVGLGGDATDCTEASGTITCDFGGGNFTTTFTAEVEVNGGEGTTVNNLATVDYDFDGQPGTITADADVQILEAPTPSPSPTPIPPPSVDFLEGSGCSLNLGAQASPFFSYGLAMLAALGMLRIKKK
jgi:uncharacterized repeat protein (TIGR01451 family)